MILQDQSPIQSFVAVRMITNHILVMKHYVTVSLTTPGMNHWASVLMKPLQTGQPVTQILTIIGKPRARITSMMMRLRVEVTAQIHSISMNLPVQGVVKPGQVQSTSIPGKAPSINGLSMVTVQTHNISMKLTVQTIVKPGMVLIFSPMVPAYSVTR